MDLKLKKLTRLPFQKLAKFRREDIIRIVKLQSSLLNRYSPTGGKILLYKTFFLLRVKYKIKSPLQFFYTAIQKISHCLR